MDEKSQLQVGDTMDQNIFHGLFPKSTMGFLIKLGSSLIRNPIVDFGKRSSKNFHQLILQLGVEFLVQVFFRFEI